MMKNSRFKKILVTGGCGFLGQHLVRNLAETFPSARIFILDLHGNANVFEDAKNQSAVSLLPGRDITDYHSIREAFKDCDAVIHCAGMVSFSLRDKGLLRRVIVEGTRNVLQACRHHKVPRLIHVSSVAALGYSNEPDHPIDETFRFDWEIAQSRKKHYMLCRRDADLQVKNYQKEGRAAVIVYPGLMFGPGDRVNSPKIIRALARGRLLFNPPGGTNVVDVRDVAQGITTVLKNFSGSEQYLLSGANLTFAEMHVKIAKLLAVRPPKITLPPQTEPFFYWSVLLAELLTERRLSLTADNVDSAFKFRYFDNSKAKRCLGWSPSVPFEMTMRDTIAWMRNGVER